jgi:hypothetical protein
MQPFASLHKNLKRKSATYPVFSIQTIIGIVNDSSMNKLQAHTPQLIARSENSPHLLSGGKIHFSEALPGQREGKRVSMLVSLQPVFRGSNRKSGTCARLTLHDLLGPRRPCAALQLLCAELPHQSSQ